MTVCDLHIHSTASDGTTPPARLASQAHRAGLRAIALTDHDTTAGIPAAAAACARHGIDFVPGIELSAQAPVASGQAEATGTLHLLGYFVRHDDPTLLDIQQQVLHARNDRNPQMIQRLRDLGVDITYDEVLQLARGSGARPSRTVPDGSRDDRGSPASTHQPPHRTPVIGRPHIAQVMVNKGYVKSIHEAFRRYIGQGAAAYVRKDRLPPDQAIAAIRNAGGLAVLAHPVQLRLPDLDALTRFVAHLKTIGLAGLEVRHPDHTPADVRSFESLARQLNLLPTGGSDYHGTRKTIPLASQQVPYTWFQALRAAADAK